MATQDTEVNIRLHSYNQIKDTGFILQHLPQVIYHHFSTCTTNKKPKNIVGVFIVLCSSQQKLFEVSAIAILRGPCHSCDYIIATFYYNNSVIIDKEYMYIVIG